MARCCLWVCMLKRWVHEAAVLPYVAAMVTHAGAGSLRTALSAGVPLALAPRFGDESSTRARSWPPAPGAFATGPGGLRDAVSALLTQPAFAGVGYRGSRPRWPGSRTPARRSRCSARSSRPSPCEGWLILSLNARMRSSYWAASRDMDVSACRTDSRPTCERTKAGEFDE